MSSFWESETYQIVKAMKRSGNRPGLIEEWKDAVERWALLPENANSADAAAVRAWLPTWQPRPFYTATELAPLWPALAIAIGYTTRMSAPKSPMRLANELDFAGLPRAIIDNVRSSYFIVERIHHWNRPITHKEFLDAYC